MDLLHATEEFNSIGTDLIAGEEAIIQIIEPKTSKQISFLKISRVVHGFVDHYKNILLSNNKIDNNFQAATLNCHIDVMCYSDWIESSKGIGITMKNDVYWCSSVLLNNQTGTNRPYF